MRDDDWQGGRFSDDVFSAAAVGVASFENVGEGVGVVEAIERSAGGGNPLDEGSSISSIEFSSGSIDEEASSEGGETGARNPR